MSEWFTFITWSSINAFLSPITGEMYDKYGAKPLFITGLLFIIISMWGVIDLTQSTTYTYLLVRTCILRIGLSFITMPLNTDVSLIFCGVNFCMLYTC